MREHHAVATQRLEQFRNQSTIRAAYSELAKASAARQLEIYNACLRAFHEPWSSPSPATVFRSVSPSPTTPPAKTTPDTTTIVDALGRPRLTHTRARSYPTTPSEHINTQYHLARHQDPIPITSLDCRETRIVLSPAYRIATWRDQDWTVPPHTYLFLEHQGAHIVLLLVNPHTREYLTIEGLPGENQTQLPVPIGSIMTTRRKDHISHRVVSNARYEMKISIAAPQTVASSYRAIVLDVTPWTSTFSEVMHHLEASAARVTRLSPTSVERYITLTLRDPFFYQCGPRSMPGQLSCDNLASVFFPYINRIDYGKDVSRLCSTPDARKRLAAVAHRVPSLFYPDTLSWLRAFWRG